MSTMQLGLAIAGVLLIFAMLAYNAWVTRQHRPRQPAPSSFDLDAGLGKEPVFDSVAEAAVAEQAIHLPLPQAKPAPALDAVIDIIAPISLDNLLSGEAVLAALPPTRRVGSKPFAIEGCNAATQRWERPQAKQRYQSLQAGVQRANRAGPINEIEYSEFVVKTQNFCDGLGGSPDFPDMLEQVARAREQDAFAAAHDAQLEFFLRARHASWSAGYVQQNAAALGFALGGVAGRMVLPAGAAGIPPLLHLSFNAQAALADDAASGIVRELIIRLDVPQVAASEQAFARMRQLAKTLADNMDAALTDDHGVLLADAALDVIAAELQDWYDVMEQCGFPAGSVRARRLFS